ncbi:MAG: hypothetical protein FWD06_02675 [Oscillospiraceae bacterium]|nr:hypothetical protein [Oscillospiraceae bacterium]
MAYFITMFLFLAISFYTFSKILNLKNVALCKIAWAMFFVAISTAGMVFAQPYLPMLRFALLALIGGVFSGLVTRTRLDISITSFSLVTKRAGQRFIKRECSNVVRNGCFLSKVVV